MTRSDGEFNFRDSVGLKEFFEEKFRHQRELMTRHSLAVSKALKLQAREYDKHFETLNHEAERIKQILALSIPREVHDRDMKELRGLVDELKLAAESYVTKESLTNMMKDPGEKIEGLKNYQTATQARATQNTDNISRLMGIAAIVISAISLAQYLFK